MIAKTAETFQFDAIDDISPLVRSAHLDPATHAARKFKEIVGLEDHVIEFEEGQRLFPVEPQPLISWRHTGAA